METKYINEVFKNYNHLSIEDKKKLSKRMIQVQEEDRETNAYFMHYYPLDKIDDLLNIIVKGNNFGNFYNSLNDEQKKEFQTEVYLNAVKTQNSEDWDISYRMETEFYNYIIELMKNTKYKTRNFSGDFKVDYDKLDKAIVYTQADFVWTSERVVEAYYYIAGETEVDSTLLDLVETLDKVLTIIKSNVNESTNNMIDSISFDNLLKTLFLTLEIDKKELDHYIKYRKELREKCDEALTRKKENRINEKKNPTRKLVKTKANKYGITRMR